MAKFRRFFINENLKINNTIKLPRDLRRHIVDVLRLKSGDLIRLFGRDGIEFLAEISLDRCGVKARILKEIRNTEKDEEKLKVTLCQALPRLKKMDLIVQKSTEVGVSKIIPFISARSVQKDARLSQKQKRWEKIMIESARQSERPVIPEIEEIMSIEDILTNNYGNALKIILSPDENNKFRDILKSVEVPKGVVVVVGPEGGFEKDEIQLAINNGFIPAKLWDNILRTETAGIIAVAIVRYEFG